MRTLDLRLKPTSKLPPKAAQGQLQKNPVFKQATVALGQKRQAALSLKAATLIARGTPPEQLISCKLRLGEAEIDLLITLEDRGKKTLIHYEEGLYIVQIPEAERAMSPAAPPPVVIPTVASDGFSSHFYNNDYFPEQEREPFLALFNRLDARLKEIFREKVNACLKNQDIVPRITQMRGLRFEILRYLTLIEQGLELVDWDSPVSRRVTFEAYPNKIKDFLDPQRPDLTLPPFQERTADIEPDIPIMRKDGPYVYEMKCMSRMAYGEVATQRNQALKYQAAINQGLISGATIELRGRIDRNFLGWITGLTIDDHGAIPDVEVVYSLPLPSGTEYRFVLKSAGCGKGLAFHNDDQPFTADDLSIVHGLFQAKADKSIVSILSEIDITDPSPELAAILETGTPRDILDLGLFEAYEQKTTQAVWDKLRSKKVIVNKENSESALSPEATPEFVRAKLSTYQELLRHNPHLARLKKAYVIEDETTFEAVITETMRRINIIAEHEAARAKIPAEFWMRNARKQMGYRGKPEGVAINIEHILMDSIQAVNKADKVFRSYEHPDRFQKIEQFMASIKGQDRHYLAITIYDPKTQRISRYEPASGKNSRRDLDSCRAQIAKRERAMLLGNIEAAKVEIERIKGRWQELNDKEERSLEETLEHRQLASRMRGIATNEPRIRKLEQKIEQQKAERTALIKATSDRAEKQRISQEGETAAVVMREEIVDAYVEALGGGNAWANIAERVIERTEQNILKAIYTTTSEGEVIVQEEVVRGIDSGRAAHSELVQGRNVYGAGELVFEKDAKHDKWVLREINNGSGHYRPTQYSLIYTKNLLIQKEIATEETELINSLVRGTAVREASLI